MWLATWNLEWASGHRHVAARRHLESIDADLIVTAEDRRVPRPTFWNALCGALEGLDIWSSGDRTDIALIDHVACTPDLTMTDLGWWSNVVAGTRLSDHAGVWVDAEVVRS